MARGHKGLACWRQGWGGSSVPVTAHQHARAIHHLAWQEACGVTGACRWEAASEDGASHLPEVALAPATTAAAGSLTVSAPPLTVA